MLPPSNKFLKTAPAPQLSPVLGGGYSHWSLGTVNSQRGNAGRFAMRNCLESAEDRRQIVMWQGI